VTTVPREEAERRLSSPRFTRRRFEEEIAQEIAAGLRDRRRPGDERAGDGRRESDEQA
jgi:hypothetical protein